jgi:hypothetical protein
MVLARYILPATPALFVLIAMIVVRATERFTQRQSSRLALTGLALAILVVEPFYNSIMLVRLLRRPDTRIEAGDWLSEHVGPTSHVVALGAPRGADFGSPSVRGANVLHGLPADRWDDFGVDWVVWHHYPLPYSSLPLPSLPPTFERVAIFSPFCGPTNAPVLEPLDAFYLPLARFDGIVRPGPYIEVYHQAAGR